MNSSFLTLIAIVLELKNVDHERVQVEDLENRSCFLR